MTCYALFQLAQRRMEVPEKIIIIYDPLFQFHFGARPKNGILLLFFSAPGCSCWPLLLAAEITCILLIYYSNVYVFISNGVGDCFIFQLLLDCAAPFHMELLVSVNLISR